ncbi:uncharacterized protein LOC142338628 isoform X1 [Convolutriloba macropyga]|uniref:uncharacterized protein LOC142338628 isoform X1 n=2 Tax=Convolutriloba macropyga TaxID=536237 RepID=UPI003F51B154
MLSYCIILSFKRKLMKLELKCLLIKPNATKHIKIYDRFLMKVYYSLFYIYILNVNLSSVSLREDNFVCPRLKVEDCNWAKTRYEKYRHICSQESRVLMKQKCQMKKNRAAYLLCLQLKCDLILGPTRRSSYRNSFRELSAVVRRDKCQECRKFHGSDSFCEFNNDCPPGTYQEPTMKEECDEYMSKFEDLDSCRAIRKCGRASLTIPNLVIVALIAALRFEAGRIVTNNCID